MGVACGEMISGGTWSSTVKIPASGCKGWKRDYCE